MSKKSKEKKDISVDETLKQQKEKEQEAATDNEIADENCKDTDTEKEESVEDEKSCDKPSKKDPKDILIEELQDKIKRQVAEFDNFRKRTEKEKSAMFEMGASDIIKKLLPIVDNFERGFKTITDEEKETPFAKGMDMVYKQTVKMLDDCDVKPIEAVGMEFNPELHNAVMHVDDESVGESVVIEEFEKGYTYRETVIRHSMVKVAN